MLTETATELEFILMTPMTLAEEDGMPGDDSVAADDDADVDAADLDDDDDEDEDEEESGDEAAG